VEAKREALLEDATIRLKRAPEPAQGSPESIQERKARHISVCLDEAVDRSRSHGGAFDSVRLPHRALPELDRDEIDTSVTFLGKRLSLPLLIGSMTGGTTEARVINRRLAEAAQRANVGMCLGSQRILLEQPELLDTFCVRNVAPDVLLVSNLGATQLMLGVSPETARNLVEQVGADALVLHLNPAQEAVQEGGDTRFSGVERALAEAIPRLGIPCGIKEVGCGFARSDVERLARLPLAFVESAGRGGTSWTRVEGLRAQTREARALGELFADWGHSSIESLRNCVDGAGPIPVIASGGIRSGLDAAKALALGASVTAMALPLLRAASESVDAVTEEIELFRAALTTAMFLTGCRDVPTLRRLFRH
jgi:isopentenyl-diphosphate delta-isomerase